MRSVNKHDTKNYLANKRIAIIQKAHLPFYARIQFINNFLVDKFIREWDSEYTSDNYDPYSLKNIAYQIAKWNTLATTQDLQRILQHSVVTRNTQTELEAAKVINSVKDTLTHIEAERVIKNLDYVGNILETSEVNLAKYELMVEKLPREVSRKSVLEKCILSEKDLPPSKRQAWLERNLQRGASHNKKYTYRELNQLSRDLERYKTNRLDYETAIMENKQADREGYGRINESKTWVWSRLEKTRHQYLDGETIPLTEKFRVENSVTGDVDMLRFPGDVENDHNSCSNICNCGCSYEINQA